MSVVAQTEIHILSTATAIPLEAVNPTKSLILVPLSQLVSHPTGRDVCEAPHMSIPEFAADIRHVGLL